MLSTALMKLLTVKAVTTAAVVTTVAAGGVATAAVTLDAKPEVAQSGDTAGVSPAKPATAGKHESGAKRKPADKHESAGRSDAPRSGGPAGAAGSPSPSLAGLCNAIGRGNKTEHGKALQSPAFRVLVTAAGGPDRVDAFCTALAASDDSKVKASDKPDNADKADKADKGRSDNSKGDHGKPDTAGPDESRELVGP